MKNYFALVPLACLVLAGCHPETVSGELGGRLLTPPRADIRVGSLYFVRERPTEALTSPARLESLCTVNLAKYGVEVSEPVAVADIDLTQDRSFSTAISGINSKLVSAGLDGSFSKYFEYKLTNAKTVEISGVEADKLFSNRGFQKDCLGWRKNIARQKWAAYQILSITYGDFSFGPKSTLSLTPTLSLKLKSVTPGIKATISSVTKSTTSGKGMVVAFTPLNRSSQ